MMPTFYAAAWLIAVVGGDPVYIPMPSMQLCHQEAIELNKITGGDATWCIAGLDTRSEEK